MCTNCDKKYKPDELIKNQERKKIFMFFILQRKNKQTFCYNSDGSCDSLFMAVQVSKYELLWKSCSVITEEIGGHCKIQYSPQKMIAVYVIVDEQVNGNLFRWTN